MKKAILTDITDRPCTSQWSKQWKMAVAFLLHSNFILPNIAYLLLLLTFHAANHTFLYCFRFNGALQLLEISRLSQTHTHIHTTEAIYKKAWRVFKIFINILKSMLYRDRYIVHSKFKLRTKFKNSLVSVVYPTCFILDKEKKLESIILDQL